MVIFDILRICAALMVFGIHLFIFVPQLPASLCEILSNGGYGVSIFFVISGFLMMQSLENSKSLKEYYVKRVARILPGYYAMVLVGIFVWDMGFGKMPVDTYGGLGWLRYLFCVNTWIPSHHYDFWNNLWGLWTINCFLFFYLIAPFLKKYINSFNKSAVFMVAMIGFTFVFSKAMPGVFAEMGAEMPGMLACDMPIYSLNTFSMGMCVWYGKKEGRLKNCMQLLTVILVGFIGLNMYNRMLWGVLCAVIMIAFMDLKIENPKINSVIKVMSRYSFCLYLVHLCVIEIVDHFGVRGVPFLALSTVSSVLAAVALYHLVEKPCAALIRKIFK